VEAIVGVQSMPIHDWTRVEAGIFHDFHHEWISIIRRTLNDRLLPSEFYALAEQQAAGFGPDILTLQTSADNNEDNAGSRALGGGVALMQPKPRVRFTAESSGEFFRRKKSTIVIRHVSGDHIVAVVEIISPGNKSGRNSFKALIDKACDLIEHRIHLLILDLLPPTKRDPNGVHAAIWREITDDDFNLPTDKQLTLASYESSLTVTAYVEPAAVGDTLTSMPVFLEPGAHILIPLEETYNTAFSAVPARWRRVLEPAG
jgi:hypothetical protein